MDTEFFRGQDGSIEISNNRPRKNSGGGNGQIVPKGSSSSKINRTIDTNGKARGGGRRVKGLDGYMVVRLVYKGGVVIGRRFI